jgi:hypothetical protein
MSTARPYPLITDSQKLALLLFDHEVSLRNRLKDMETVRRELLPEHHLVARIDNVEVTSDDIVLTITRDVAGTRADPPARTKLICSLTTDSDTFRFTILDAHP